MLTVIDELIREFIAIEVSRRLLSNDVLQAPGNVDSQAFATILVDHRQHAECPAVLGSGLDEVVGPDMVSPAGPQADARSIIQPQPAPLGLFLGNLEPLRPPDALYPLVVHMPALGPQQGRDPPTDKDPALKLDYKDAFELD